MTARVALALWLVVSSAVPAQEASLPEWNEADRAALKKVDKPEKGSKSSKSAKAGKEEQPEVIPLIPGSGLLADEHPAEWAQEPQPEPLAFEPPTAEEIAGDRIPQALVPESCWAAYFADRPGPFLLDPQNLLNADERSHRSKFLADHAADSTIDFYVYLFDGPQSIPSEVRVEELIERLYMTDRPAAVVFYFMGAPEKTELRLSPSLGDRIPLLEQRRALQNSTAIATEKSGRVEQLEAFCQQFSIRLYWMERVMKGHPEGPVAGNSAPVSKPEAADERKAKMLAVLRPWLLPLGSGIGGMGLLLALSWFWKTKARYRFPEFEVESRLAGNHAAGIGAVISFVSASLPPGVQREQVPDYLHRA